MNAESLKNSILQLAIQGKLVEQREEEGTAEELYKEIQLEKEKLIEEGKIKRQKKLPEITEEEIPFEIPKTWKWVRLIDLGVTQTGNTPPRKHPENFGVYIPFISPADILNGNINYENNGLSELGKSKGRICNENSILQVCIGGSIGKCAITDKIVAFNQQINSLTPIKVNYLYAYYILQSYFFQNKIKEKSTGTATPIINKSSWEMLLLPLPPLAEQKRIVAKIEELMPLVERYGKAFEEVTSLNKRFPIEMEKSILQYAIQGKLVEQREEEGTAEDLYKQIQLEKEKLIEEGKIRKQQKLPDIIAEEIPFEIPETWKWVRLGELLLKLTDGAHHTPRYTEQGVPFLSVKDISSGVINFSNTRFVSEETHKKLYERCNPEFGDILLTKVGTTGVPVIVDTDIEFSLFVSVALLKFNQQYLFNEYLLYLIQSPFVQMQAKEKTRGVGNKNWVMRDIANTIIPLPPLEEQYRIVREIHKYQPYIRKMIKSSR